MNIQSPDRFHIPVADGLDAIVVYVECWPGQKYNRGMITAVCDGEAWNFVAGNIGNQTMLQFLSDCNADYLASKFTHEPRFVTNYDEISRAVNKDAEDGREIIIESECDVSTYAEEVAAIFGWDFAHDLPETQNHKFTYVVQIAERIIQHLSQLAESA